MNWREISLFDIEKFQESATKNDFFASNCGAANSFLYAKKFKAKIAIEDGWIFEKILIGNEPAFSFPRAIDGDSSKIKEAVKKLADEAASIKKGLLFRGITEEQKEILLNFFSKSES